MGTTTGYLKKLRAEAKKNLATGTAFLLENALQENIVQLPSGMQYEILVAGEGKKPHLKDRITCHYEGKLLDGTIFDSSLKRKKPVSFGVNEVIEGWVEALQLMPVGSKWRLFIPANLAYGDQQVSKEIGANSTLIFEVELLSIK